jgi:hypothetical protein
VIGASDARSLRVPGYYAVFNSGPHLTSQQRYGLGLMWQPEMGSLLQSQTGTSNAAWGTILGQSQGVYESDTLNVEFTINGRPLAARFGNHDLPSGVLSIKYSFPDQGEKTLTFNDRQLTVEIQHSGPFREQIPLLIGKGDSLEIGPAEVRLVRQDKSLAITFDQAKVDTIETGLMVGPRRVVTLSLQTQNRLTYSFKF